MTGKIKNSFDIGRAIESDLDGIMTLQAKNQPACGGTLSANFPKKLIATIIHETPVIVARQKGDIVGYLITSTKEQNITIPIINAMLSAYPGKTDSHVYGPICVKAEERGNGIAQALFLELHQLEPNREYILFIRADNTASMRAHKKMGMCTVANFVFCENKYVVFSSLRSTDIA